MKQTALLLAAGLVLILSVIKAYTLRTQLDQANRQLSEMENEKLRISYLVGNLGECFEIAESGVDQGCRKQIDPVVALGNKAVPYLMHAIERHDWHMVLNAARCLREINPALTPEQIRQLERRQRFFLKPAPAQDQSSPPAATMDTLNQKHYTFTALALGSAIDAILKK
jgi:uncharacterized protein YjeT (DUF2065 family)